MKKKADALKIFLRPTGVITFLLIVCSGLTVWNDTSFALQGADVAIYNDSIAPAGYAGTWQDGIIAIKNMLSWMDLSHEDITYQDLNDPSLDLSTLYKVLVVPGGSPILYHYWISKSGKSRIRNFVKEGGGYFGICAGSFFAADVAIWEGISYDDNTGYNAYGELIGYDMDLLPGAAVGPINGIAYYEIGGYQDYDMAILNFENENDILSGYKDIPHTEAVLYYGGPYFSIDEGADVDILSVYDYNKEAAIVAFPYGSGRVVLSGPHPEIEEDCDRDGVTMDKEDQLDDLGSDWELAKHLFIWLMSGTHPSCPELHSWNGVKYELVGSLYTKTHCPQSEYHQTLMIPPIMPQTGALRLLIREIDKEISYVNSLNIFYRYGWETPGNWTSMPLLNAIHSREGNVMEGLLEKDHKRVYMKPGDEIAVQFGLPYMEDASGIQLAAVASGYYLWSHEQWCEVLALGPELRVEPRDIITVKAYVNNMSTEALPDNAMVRFTLLDGMDTPVGSVSLAGLAPGNPRWYSLNRIVPEDFAAGTYAYRAEIWVADSNITWEKRELVPADKYPTRGSTRGFCN